MILSAQLLVNFSLLMMESRGDKECGLTKPQVFCFFFSEQRNPHSVQLVQVQQKCSLYGGLRETMPSLRDERGEIGLAVVSIEKVKRVMIVMRVLIERMLRKCDEKTKKLEV